MNLFPNINILSTNIKGIGTVHKIKNLHRALKLLFSSALTNIFVMSEISSHQHQIKGSKLL